MTIKELITTKFNKAKKMSFLFWLAFVATMFTPNAEKTLLPIIPFVGFGGSIIYTMYFIKCPRCNMNLGQIGMKAGNPFSNDIKLNYCPNCGVNFDEQI